MQPLRHGALATAALLVPRPQRGEWLKEWRSELWYVCCESDKAQPWEHQKQVTSFCLGAFKDALCLRRYAPRKKTWLAVAMETPGRCIAALVICLAVCVCAAYLLPGVRAERSLSAYHAGQGLVLIQDAELYDEAQPTITQVQYRAWTQRNQRNFEGLAFYRIVRESVSDGSELHLHRKTPHWNVAHASPNLFVLLRLPIEFTVNTPSAAGDLPLIVLSESGWRRAFGADTRVAGHIVHVGNRDARIAGVAPDGLSGLPGEVDAWLLEPPPLVVSSRPGYVVARLSASGQSMMQRPRERIVAHRSRISEDDLLGVSLHNRMPPAWVIFLFPFLLAVVALPAATPLSCWTIGASREELLLARSLLGWGFLVAKIAMLVPIAYFASLDLAYGPSFLPLHTAIGVQMISSFCIGLFGMRWALLDQWHRCPVCLRRVALPARVGSASRTFLGWNGTEFMCPSGHALLHVPELPTSWFSAPRWLLLDPSWELLYSSRG
jgi:hypothetical protein